MNSYPQRVRENILPLSVAGTLPEAFQEWYFTEETHDYESCEAECELCNQEELRYHFKIKNRDTFNELWVGSHCILKFEVPVYDQGMILDRKGAKKKLEQLKKKMQLESCIKALTNLAAKENNDILRNALNYYKINKYLTPKFAYVVFWRLDANNIDYKSSFFKVSLRKSKYKDDLRSMPTTRVHRIWKAFNRAQRDIAINMGHKPPVN